MSESKHTPGPWRVCANYGCGNQVTSLSGIVATAEDGYAATRQEALANARLIAAAPDLLEACELAWADYGRYGDISATSLEKVEAAITPARKDK